MVRPDGFWGCAGGTAAGQLASLTPAERLSLFAGLTLRKSFSALKLEPMDTENLDDTMPTRVGDETQQSTPPGGTVPTLVPPIPEQAPKGKNTSWMLWGVLAIFVLGIFVIVGGFLGYQQGIDERTSYESEQVSLAVSEQYNLGVEDLAAGRYEIARQRFDYVLQNNPNYPGVMDQMAEVLLILNATATPTPIPATPIPTMIVPTPTPDLRGDEELFVHAQNFIADKQWTDAIETLETLRKKNPGYKAIDIDGLFFVAFRNRGAQNIGTGNLESGIYDLTLAEQFGVLDTEANGYRTWARYYITGASFWGIDWAQAIYYFSQVAPQYPNMQDGTGWTASQRYIEALAGYGQWFETQGKYCDAEAQYNAAWEASGDQTYRDARENASDKCNGQ